MDKNMLKPLGMVAIISLVLFGIHHFGFSSPAQEAVYSIPALYLFHFIVTSVVFVLCSLIADLLKEQIGLVFLGSVFLKMILLYLIFKDVFGSEDVEKSILIGFVLPYILYLGLEVYLVLNVLKEIDFTKKEDSEIKDETN
ncbi:MAG: DUF6168 family protein [Flavobacteriales bacterium]